MKKLLVFLGMTKKEHHDLVDLNLGSTMQKTNKIIYFRTWT